MNKQQFLGASLHTGLKVLHFDANRESEHICKIEIWHNEEVTISDSENEYDLLLDDLIPIARPLSDLTNPIVHNGETFIPIVELAKIAFPFDVYNISESNCIITSEMMNNKPYNYMACFKTPHFMDDKQLTTLVIYPNDLHFQHRQFVHGRECTHPVHNILNIILKLIEWHFNLMDESEPFIPVTNEFNPYK